jgi:hypothetical protein
MAEGKHPEPFRTRQLSPPAPMVVVSEGTARVGCCLDLFLKGFSKSRLDHSGFVPNSAAKVKTTIIGCAGASAHSNLPENQP